MEISILYNILEYSICFTVIILYIVLVVFHVRFVTSKSEKSESKSSLTVLLTVVRADLDEPTFITELDNNWNSQALLFKTTLFPFVHSPVVTAPADGFLDIFPNEPPIVGISLEKKLQYTMIHKD